MPITMQIPAAEVVGEEKNDVGFGRRCGGVDCGRRKKQREGEGESVGEAGWFHSR
jgi:hypothetical protein